MDNKEFTTIILKNHSNSKSLLDNDYLSKDGNGVSVIITSPNSDMSISDASGKTEYELVFPVIIGEIKYDYGLSLNIIKSVMGMGILGITYTFKQSGYFYVFIMLLISLLTGYNAVNVGKFVSEFVQLEKYKNLHITYFNLSDEIFGKKMKIFTQVIWSFEIISCCILIINLSFSFLNQLAGLKDNLYLLCGMIGFFYSVTFINNYNNLKFLSIIGLTSIVALFCFLLYTLIFDLVNDSLPNVERIPFDYRNIPQSISITLFSFGGHVVFPEIFSSSKNKLNLKKNIIITWTIFSIFVNCFVFVGFFLFGDSISENIIDNLDQSYWFKKIITLLLLLNVIFTFPLMFTPLNLRIMLNINSLNINNTIKIILSKYIVRLCLIIIICLIGSYWKSYISIMSLVGGLFENTTSVILPAMFALKHLELNVFEKTINILILESGFILLFFTVFSNVTDFF
jgi:vesicular inhibitory amino acid transporter